MNLQRNLNDISVRSFILTGAPANHLTSRRFPQPSETTFEQEERYAEDVIIGCFLLAALIRLATLSRDG